MYSYSSIKLKKKILSSIFLSMYQVVISTYLPKFSLYIRINQQEALSTGKPLSEEDRSTPGSERADDDIWDSELGLNIQHKVPSKFTLRIEAIVVVVRWGDPLERT